MIKRVRGQVEQIAEDHIIVDVGAFGVAVYIPPIQLGALHEGQPLALFTHFHVREQELTLFGFMSSEELQLFRLLIGVNGVGPRLALNILSTLPPDTIRMAVVNDEPGLLTRVPGIGSKSARKILFQLKDKLDLTDFDVAGVTVMADEDNEVVEALIALGYSVVEAQRAVQNLPPEADSIEERLRLALSHLLP